MSLLFVTCYVVSGLTQTTAVLVILRTLSKKLEIETAKRIMIYEWLGRGRSWNRHAILAREGKRKR